MCYDISFTVNIPQLSEYFPDLVFDEQIEIQFGDHPIDGSHIMGHAHGAHPIIYRNRDDGRLHCRPMEWGCIPYYITDEKEYQKQRTTMLVTRSERILLDQKSYWFRIRNRRCLIPVSGFYEHRGIRGWKKKVPYYIRLKDQPAFFIPGLYSVAELPDRETGELVKRWTYSLITRPANETMRYIHNDGEHRHRMPLLLPFELSRIFLDGELPPAKYQELLDYEMPSDRLDYYPVYTIRSPRMRPDEQAKNMPWSWDKLPPLGEMQPD